MTGEERDDERRVEEFFAARRAEIPDQPADEMTWQRIRDRHRREVRGSRWGVAAGVAVAAGVLAVGGYAMWPQLTPEDPPQVAGPSDSVTGSATGSPTGSPTTPATESPTAPSGTGTVSPTDGGQDTLPEGEQITAGDAPAVVPDDLWVSGVSEAGEGGLVALGVTSAAEHLLVRSDDAGESWQPVADLSVLGSPEGLEFVTRDRGYAWTSDATVFLTEDGGRQWTALPVPGDSAQVRDVAEVDGLLVVTFAEDCTEDGCGDLVVATGPAMEEVGRLDLAPSSAARLEVAGDAAYVVVSGGQEPATQVRRLQDGRLEQLAAPMDCGPTVSFAAARDGSEVFLACALQDAQGSPTPNVAVARSTTGGRTWGAPGEGLALPGAESGFVGPDMLHLAAAGEQQLVWVSYEETLTSTDGGGTWFEPEAPLPVTAGGVRTVSTGPSGAVFVTTSTLDVDSTPSFWATDDGGLSWRLVELLP